MYNKTMSKIIWYIIAVLDLAIFIGGSTFLVYFKAITWGDVGFLIELLTPVVLFWVVITQLKGRAWLGDAHRKQ